MNIEPDKENPPFIFSIWESVKQIVVKLASLVRSGLSNILSFIQWLLITAWLMLLYALALWLVLGTLTAFNFQTELSAFGTKQDVLEVIRGQQRIAEQEWQLRGLNRRLDSVSSQLVRRERELSEQIIRSYSTTSEVEKQRLKERINNINREINQSQILKLQLEEDIELKNYGLNRQYKLAESDDPKNKKIRELSDDFIYMGDWEFDNLVLMPKNLLVLILTISMGALGSVIHLTWEFFDLSKKKHLTWYIFRPFLGGILAFAIFILVKSGQMFVSSAPPSGGSAEGLNPFFISFLAIVSGMLSEQAYTRISAAGSRVLALPVSEVKRYVRKNVLSKLLKEQRKSGKDLVRYVQEPQARVDAWFKEQESLSEHHQEILSAWLGVSTRDLFTDLKADTDEPEDIVEQEVTTEEEVEEAPETKL